MCALGEVSGWDLRVRVASAGSVSTFAAVGSLEKVGGEAGELERPPELTSVRRVLLSRER